MNCSSCSTVGMIGHWLVIVGALNWGLVGLGGFLNMNLNLVTMVLGSMPQLEWAVYIVIGLAAVYKLFACCKCKA